jgi:hypothetical protein
MPSKNKKNTKRSARMSDHKKFPVLKVVVTLSVLAILFSAAGFSFAAAKEENDSFCASCHTQPESTFYQRESDAQPSDLASFHTGKKTNCIDCHSGQGIPARMKAELLGAHNALAYVTGTAVQPAKLTVKVADENCLKCHEQVLPRSTTTQEFEEGGNEHQHLFLPRWQAADPNAATCVDCHAGHDTTGNASLSYLNREHTLQVCQDCHNAMRERE